MSIWTFLFLILQVPHATYGHHGNVLLPDLQVTPGTVASRDTSIICNQRTFLIRHTTETMKKEVYEEYGVTTHPEGSYEVDHLIPLELGGADVVANLWPQPANPVPGFHQKDEVENWLHNEVCGARINIVIAQHEIATDWYAVYLRMPK